MKTFKDFLETKGLTEESFTGSTLERQGELLREHNTELKAGLTALDLEIKSKAKTEDVSALKLELKNQNVKFQEIVAEQLETVQKSLKEVGLLAQKAAKNTGVNKVVSSGDKVAAFLLEQKDNLSLISNGSSSEAKGAEFSFELETKDISIGGSISGGNVPVEQRIEGVNNLATRQIRLLDVIAKGSALSNIISWVYEATETGAVGGTAEGALKNQIDITWAVDNQTVKKRTAFIKATTESLTDISWMETQINGNLQKRLGKDIESQVHAGDNLLENLNGLKTIASPFAAGTFASTVDNANEIDVLIVAMDNIMIRDLPFPDFITMFPSDVTQLKLIKTSSTDRRYVDRLTLVAGQMALDGVPIIATTLETPGEYLIGNGNLATLYDKGSVRVNVGLDGNDFTMNKRTILAEWRGALVVETNDRPAFVTGVFATDKLAINV